MTGMKMPVGALILVGLLSAACATTPTPTPTTASATPGPTPVGLVLPPSCKYVGAAAAEATSTSWAFDCGAAANADARRIIRPALVQAGWTFCGGAAGRDVYAKDAMTMYVENPGNAPGSPPSLMQTSQRVACP